MGRLAVCTILALAALVSGCASTDAALPRSRDLVAPVEPTWYAAIDALHAFGARIVAENRTGRMISARLEAPDVGGVVTLDVTLREWLDGTQVRVGARLAGATDPDTRAALRQIEEDLLDLIQQTSRRLMSTQSLRQR